MRRDISIAISIIGLGIEIVLTFVASKVKNIPDWVAVIVYGIGGLLIIGGILGLSPAWNNLLSKIKRLKFQAPVTYRRESSSQTPSNSCLRGDAIGHLVNTGNERELALQKNVPGDKEVFFNRLRNEGITNFYFSRNDYVRYRVGARLGQYLKTASTTITIMAFWLAESIELQGIGEDLGEIITKPSFKSLKIALVDPDSEICSPISELLLMKDKEVRSRIRSSLKYLYDLKMRLPERLKQKFSLKVYDVLPIASVVMIDIQEKYGKIQFDFKIYHAPRAKSFAFELSNTGGDFYRLCSQKYTELFDNCEEYKP